MLITQASSLSQQVMLRCKRARKDSTTQRREGERRMVWRKKEKRQHEKSGKQARRGHEKR